MVRNLWTGAEKKNLMFPPGRPGKFLFSSTQAHWNIDTSFFSFAHLALTSSPLLSCHLLFFCLAKVYSKTPVITTPLMTASHHKQEYRLYVSPNKERKVVQLSLSKTYSSPNWQGRYFEVSHFDACTQNERSNKYASWIIVKKGSLSSFNTLTITNEGNKLSMVEGYYEKKMDTRPTGWQFFRWPALAET